MAKPLTVDVPHSIGADRARERIERNMGKVNDMIAKKLGSGVSIEHQWAADRMDVQAKAMGQTIDARVDVADDNVHIEVDLPWLMKALSGPLREGLEKNVGKLLIEKKA